MDVIILVRTHIKQNAEKAELLSSLLAGGALPESAKAEAEVQLRDCRRIVDYGTRALSALPSNPAERATKLDEIMRGLKMIMDVAEREMYERTPELRDQPLREQHCILNPERVCPHPAGKIPSCRFVWDRGKRSRWR